jgi:3-keto-disaccharide hydrolase
MTNSPAPKLIRPNLLLVRAFLFVASGLAVAAIACTPATPDTTPVTGAGGSAVGAATGTGTGGSGASVGTSSGGSMAPGGSPDDGNGNGGSASTGVGGLAVSGTGGSSNVGSGGSIATGPGGSVGAGGSPAVGAGGTVGAGGAGAAPATGCNWIHNTTNDTWTFGTPAPADKIVLFDGTTLAGWHKENMPGVAIGWQLVAGGAMQVVPSGTGQATEVQSNMKFDNLCVHVEYMTPVFPSTTTDVQKQGNSGVYLKSAYEMQILDTSKLGPLIDGCGAVYKVQAPLVVACYQYLIWNTYEIEFQGSVWDASGKKTKDAVMVRVALNGKLVQLNVDLNPSGGFTQAGIPDAPGPQPLGLQDHLDLVQFRNIWATIPKY